jgi:hypothetical protein
MKTALRARVKGNTAAGSRVDWGLRPQAKALPAIRLTQVPTPKFYHMGGADDTQQFRVQADCFGETYQDAQELGDEVVALLEPATGSFQGSFVTRDFDRPEVIDTGPVHCRVLEFLVTHISA